MKALCSGCLIALLQLVTWSAIYAEPLGAADRDGMRRVSSKPFSTPPESKIIPLDGADFESGKIPPGWAQGHGEVLTADDAPQGKHYFRMKSKKGADLRSPWIVGEPGAVYFISYWLKTSDEPWAYIHFTSDEREPSFTNIYPGVGFNTDNQWKQVGFYFWLPAQCKTMQFLLAPREEGAEGAFVSVDDVRLRTASESEAAAANDAERAHLPPYDVTSRPGDGKNLALSVAKWEGRAGIPGKPFVIWALGSSYTDWQGDGFELIQAIRKRFPNAPPIVYRKHGGPGTPWEYVHGWVKQFVAAEQPDLIFTYTGGSLEGLDALLTEIRRHCTAETIVPSLHFKPPGGLTPNEIEIGQGVTWAKAREICEQHGAEFVENRRELADYLTRNNLDMEALLSDHNHQNLHGRTRIWDNVSRHLAKSDQSTCTPESRERRVAVAPPMETSTEKVSLTGNWTTTDGLLRSTTSGDRMRISFTGNRIDLVGRKSPVGGTVKLLVDGAPGDQAPVFVMNSIMPQKRHLWRIPHVVDLGPSIEPQKWTITMTSDVGDYRLEGSLAGFDGAGNLAQPFRGRSGQIGIDPKFWRQGRVEKKDQPVEYGVASGDYFTFDVFRGAAGALSFKADQPSSLIEPLVRNLPNDRHTIELITNGDGEVAIEYLYVYQPAEKD
jgi:hypothetical protein